MVLLFLLAAVSTAAATTPPLWPLPTHSSFEPSAALPVTFNLLKFKLLGTDASAPLPSPLAAACTRYSAIILGVPVANRTTLTAPNTLAVEFDIADIAAPLSPGATDHNESYGIGLAAASQSMRITAASQWGALRALETLAQLTKRGSAAGSFTLPGGALHVDDAPRFGWRGLMIDTGRNYLTTTTIKMALDAMAYCKLNVLHWHITDDQSFPLLVPTPPSLATLADGGAFSPKHVYTLDDVSAIMAYARARGIAVLPEFDMPGHSTSWTNGNPALRSRCSGGSGHENGGFSRPLDPTSNATYALIDMLLATVDPFFSSEFPFWHLGGDEVEFGCWQHSEGGYIDAWMAANGIAKGDYPALQEYFEQRVIATVRSLPSKKRTILWEDNSPGHTSGLPKDAVVNLWKERKGDAHVLDATIRAGWQVIYTSPDWYFDHWLGTSNMEVGSWEFVYSLDPFLNSSLPLATLNANVLGAEAAMWAPYFDSTNFLTQAFPRAAAVAERLWSAATVVDVADAQVRLHAWRCRLLARGLATAPVYGGVPSGARGTANATATTTFGNHCEEGPWEVEYSPPFREL